MAKRRGRRVVRLSFVVGFFVAAIVFVYGYWAPFDFQPTIVRNARHEMVNPYLVAAVIRVESGFRADAVSRRGAVGLMQLMPTSAAWIGLQIQDRKKLNLRDPATNIALGTWYLRYLLTAYHQNPVLALAAYNGGPATVDHWLASGVLTPQQNSYQNIPYPETANFVRRVREFEVVYRILYAWMPTGQPAAAALR